MLSSSRTWWLIEMKLNIPSSIELSDIYVSDPFTLYEMENVFEDKVYNKLREEFPDRSFFNKSYGKKEHGNKSYLHSNEPLFFDFLEQSEVWKNLYLTMNTETTVKKLFSLMIDDIKKIPERKKFPRLITLENIKFFPRWNLSFMSKLYDRISKLMNPKVNRIRVLFEFSRLGNDCFVPPHTEVDRKIFNLLLYFPDQNISEFDRNRLGTRFYKRTKKNLDTWESTYMDADEAKNFQNNYEVFHTAKFSENKFVGLIKSSNSWHDTETFNDLKEDRKSFNMFFYLC